jgi:Gram-negative bacterial TonB protein C-terminal
LSHGPAVRWWLAASLTIGAALPLDGQTVQPRLGSIGSTCAFDTAAVRDTSRYTVFLAWRESSDAAELGSVLRAIAASFVAPTSVTSLLWPGTYFPDPDSSRQTQGSRARAVGPFTGELWIELNQGRVERAAWHLAPGSPQLQSAVLQAVQRADSGRTFSGLTPSKTPRRRTLRLTLGTAAESEPSIGMPILRLRLPTIRVEHPVTVIHIPRPAYTIKSVRAKRSGGVDLQYVVSEDGRASPLSMRVVEADDSAFAAAARAAVVAGRFRPARVLGCPVQMLVQQRISYRF